MAATSNLACETCPVRDRAACSVLSAAERDELARSGRTIKLQRGEVLFRAGDENVACATLQTGALKVGSTDAEGHDRILALIHPAGFVGELFQPFSRYDVTALTDSTLCLFSSSSLEGGIERFPALATALLRRAQEDVHGSRELLGLLGNDSAQVKVAGLLLAFAHAASQSPCHPAAHFELPLARGELADMLGLTIETVSRQIGALEKAGVIKRNGPRGIELVDAARLVQLSQ